MFTRLKSIYSHKFILSMILFVCYFNNLIFTDFSICILQFSPHFNIQNLNFPIKEISNPTSHTCDISTDAVLSLVFIHVQLQTSWIVEFHWIELSLTVKLWSSEEEEHTATVCNVSINILCDFLFFWSDSQTVCLLSNNKEREPNVDPRRAFPTKRNWFLARTRKQVAREWAWLILILLC